MKVQIKTWLLILKNLGPVTRAQEYIPKLEALNYRSQLDDPCYHRSPALAAVHFVNFGAREIAERKRDLFFSVQGRTFKFYEASYVVFLPQAKEAVSSGAFPDYPTHFVLAGFDLIKAGKAPGYLDPELEDLANAGPDLALVDKLEAVGYRSSLADPRYSESPLFAANHFRRIGAQEIIRGNRPFHFTCNGQTFAYKEQPYLFLNMDIGRAVETGYFHSGLEHLVLYGYDEMKAGGRSAYLDEAAKPLLESGVGETESDHPRIFLTQEGKEVDFVEDLYLKSHPEAALAIRAHGYPPALQYFFHATLPLIRAGKTKLYTESYFPEVLKSFDGEAKHGSNLCLFAHYDPGGLIDPHVVRYLEGLKSMDCEVVFITGSAGEEECKKVAHLCSEFILRNEYGRDFGSWYLAVRHCQSRLDRYRHIIWANDSVYFPLNPVEGLIAEIERESLDVWALHESLEMLPHPPPGLQDYHLMSYFVGFSAKAVTAGILTDFVERFESHPVQSKKGQKLLFEFWLAQRAFDLALRVGALSKIEVMGDGYTSHKGLPWNKINPTLHLWRQSLSWYRSPALKVKLALDDPDQTFSFEQLESLVDPKDYDLNLMQDHTARLATGPKPSIIRPVEVKALSRIDRSPFAGFDTLCAFIHYDSDGIIRPYVLRSLQALEEMGCEFIFVSGTTKDEELEKLPDSCRRIIRKDPASEAARDMGAYWLALSDLSPEDLKFRRYLLANDSVFFPVADHKRMFAEMEARDLDLWGVVESRHTTWHVMGYFWNFSKECFEKDFLSSFVSGYRCEYAKWEHVRLYEMRYPAMLRNMGYKVDSYVKVEDVRAAAMERFKSENPSKSIPPEYLAPEFNVHNAGWDLLISKFNCPALKIEFLRDTVRGAAAQYQLKDLLTKYTRYDYALIVDKFGDPQ
jgi:lipopolysaccharide biosynthesis protein